MQAVKLKVKTQHPSWLRGIMLQGCTLIITKENASPGQTFIQTKQTSDFMFNGKLGENMIVMPLTWLLPQSHDWHDIMRHVKVWKHGQVCQSVGQLVQLQHLQQIHDLISATLQQEEARLIPAAARRVQKWRKGTDPSQSINATRSASSTVCQPDSSRWPVQLCESAVTLLPTCSQLLGWLKGSSLVAGQQICVSRG